MGAAHLLGRDPGGAGHGLGHHAFQGALVQFPRQQADQELPLVVAGPAEQARQQPSALRLRARPGDLADHLEHGIGLGHRERARFGRGAVSRSAISSGPLSRNRVSRNRVSRNRVSRNRVSRNRVSRNRAAWGGTGRGRSGLRGRRLLRAAHRPGGARPEQISQGRVAHAYLALPQFPGKERDHDRDLAGVRPAQQRRDLRDLGGAPGRGRDRFRRLDQLTQQHNGIVP